MMITPHLLHLEGMQEETEIIMIIEGITEQEMDFMHLIHRHYEITMVCIKNK